MAIKSVNKKTAPKKKSVTNNSFKIIEKSKLPLFIGIVVVVGILYLLKGFFVVATVNDQPILRLSLIQELENQSGKRTLDSLIIKSLILQETKKQNITVDKKEIDEEIIKAESSLAKQGQTLDSVLAMQGLTKEGLVEQIRFEKLIQKLVGKDVQVTDKEVDEYLEQNKDTLVESSDAAQLKEVAKEQLKRQKVSEKFQSWLADLQKKAKINYFVQFP